MSGFQDYDDRTKHEKRLEANNMAFRCSNDKCIGIGMGGLCTSCQTKETMKVMLAALKGVIAVADRNTDEFNAARAAIKLAEKEVK